MKKLLTLFGTVIALVALIGCESSVTLEAPVVTYTVDNDGADLVLTWTEVTDADGYIIYGDGVVLDTVTALTYTVTTPVALVEVTAYSGDTESDADQIDCEAVVTSSITVYGMSDTSSAHPSGLQFTATGTAVPLAVQSSNYPDLDFVFDDRSPLTTITLVSPGDFNPQLNPEDNASAESGTDFNALQIAADLGNYNTQRALSNQAVYSLWIDPDAGGYTTDDHFGKMKIESISGSTAPYTVVITCAYQLITGLRWVVTP